MALVAKALESSSSCGGSSCPGHSIYRKSSRQKIATPATKKRCRPNNRSSKVRAVLGAKALRGSSNNRPSSSIGMRGSSSQGIAAPGPTMNCSHVVSTTSSRGCNRRKIVEF